MRRERVLPRLAIAAAAALLVTACGKKASSVLPDSWEVSLAKAGEAWIAKDPAKTWTLCENGFEIAAKGKHFAKTLDALDCLGEMADKQGQPAKALPFHERFLADHRATLTGQAAGHRVRNNHGVLLYATGRREEAVAALREALVAEDGTPFELGPLRNPHVYHAIVRNLAIAWYASASSAEARAWVSETGAGIAEPLESAPANRVSGQRGATKALDALIAIGDRQALEATALWRRLVGETRALEDDLEKHDPTWRRLCETKRLGEIGLPACLREIPS